jgi:hypothetical protein
MRAAGVLICAAICLAAIPGTGAARLPTGQSHCEAKAVRSTLLSFTTAFNREDLAALDEIFAQKPDFQWYTTDGRSGQEAKSRDTLIPYFRRRHVRGDRLGLASFRFTGNSPHYGNFEMTMRRSNPDVAGGRWQRIPGKGAAVCAGGATRLIVMSFGNVPGR